MFPSVQASREWGGKFSRTLSWEWGRVESLLELLVGNWGADLQIRGGGRWRGRSSRP